MKFKFKGTFKNKTDNKSRMKDLKTKKGITNEAPKDPNDFCKFKKYLLGEIRKERKMTMVKGSSNNLRTFSNDFFKNDETKQSHFENFNDIE